MLRLDDLVASLVVLWVLVGIPSARVVFGWIRLARLVLWLLSFCFGYGV